MTTRKILFNNNNNNNINDDNNIPTTINTYYQICTYKNNNTNLYSVRKIKFNNNMNIIESKIKYFPKKVLEKFIEKNKFIKQNKIKLYPYDDINYVNYPSSAELNEGLSSLLNGNSLVNNIL